MIVCVYEDRRSCLVGVKLTVLSVARHHPDLRISVSVPQPPSEFAEWVAGVPQASLVTGENFAATGWDVKPGLLLARLREGQENVVWIDSDIILNGPLPSAVTAADRETLVATEEPYWGRRQGGVDRAVAWGLEPGRRLPATVNTGVVRVTAAHEQLLERWRLLSMDERYRDARTLDWSQRPVHAMGGQDLLTALLTSADFADVPVTLLHRGVDIAQCHGPAGYTARERWSGWRSGRGLPPLVHAQSHKPWESFPRADRSAPMKTRLELAVARMHVELSPYRPVASAYRDQLGEPAPWLDELSRPSAVLSRVARHDPVLRELPLSAFDGLARRALGKARQRKPLMP